MSVAHERPIAVVAGYLVRNPLGGHALSILHWLVGLRRLGFDVVFVEEYGWWDSCYDPQRKHMGNDPSPGISRLREDFARLGLERWCFVDIDGRYHGMSRAELEQACTSADVMVSLWMVSWLDAFLECRRRIFIDTDPGFTQFGMKGAESQPGYASPHDFDAHFTYGTRIGLPGSPIPTHGINWQPTRPPIAIELVPFSYDPDARFFTTIMSWSNRPPVIHDGEEYGQKDVEFAKVFDLPAVAGQSLEIALGGEAAPRAALREAGWSIIDAGNVSATPWSYLDYIARSRGEFSVAVNLEVKTQSGWFSDRTAAYLAAGKPAVVQETGFSESLPTGRGVFAFEDIAEAVSAFDVINADYRRHCEAARAIAEEHFDSDIVISSILSRSGIRVPNARARS